MASKKSSSDPISNGVVCNGLPTSTMGSNASSNSRHHNDNHSLNQGNVASGDNPTDPSIIAGRSSNGDVGMQSTEWIDAILQELWPFISQYVHKTLKETLEQQIQAAVPKALSSIHLDKMDLGTVPMQFGSMLTKKQVIQSADGDLHGLELVVDVVYRGNANFSLALNSMSVGI